MRECEGTMVAPAVWSLDLAPCASGHYKGFSGQEMAL